MAEVELFYDKAGNTLTVWFADPGQEHVSEETGDEAILMKDLSGSVIGFEKLNFSAPHPDLLRLSFETTPEKTGNRGHSNSKQFLRPEFLTVPLFLFSLFS